jgi:hypothetical protein
VVLQIIVQVAIKAARPAMDASFSEPLRRLIAKCWAQVALACNLGILKNYSAKETLLLGRLIAAPFFAKLSLKADGNFLIYTVTVGALLKIDTTTRQPGKEHIIDRQNLLFIGSPSTPQLLRDHAPDRDSAGASKAQIRARRSSAECPAVSPGGAIRGAEGKGHAPPACLLRRGLGLLTGIADLCCCVSGSRIAVVVVQ